MTLCGAIGSRHTDDLTKSHGPRRKRPSACIEFPGGMLCFTRNAVWSTVWIYEYRDDNLGAPIFSHTSLKYPSLLPGPQNPGRGGEETVTQPGCLPLPRPPDSGHGVQLGPDRALPLLLLLLLGVR